MMDATIDTLTTIKGREEATILRMSYEEYLEWADEDVHAEWVGGRVIVQMPAKYFHQVLVDFLSKLIGLYVDAFGLGQVLIAPFEVKLWPGGPAREPDLLFVSKVNQERLTEDRVVGPPDLVVEIISRGSVHQDRVDKFDEYERAGVQEYWLLDNRPKRKRALFYRLDESGQFQQVAIEEGIYHSAVLPGFWLRLEWLWQEQPNMWLALAEVIGPEKVQQALQDALHADRGEKRI
jgi:Uma2 family endonuclease